MSSPITTADWLDFEDGWLAPYAMPSRASRGRRHPEPDHPFRSLYQRDRERIVHCTAFRRMTGKTQVLVASVNDHHRTRLTHTLEVTQVARTAARRLRLNEDLTEAIALAHDIGHPPFGHAGEAALDECLAGHGSVDFWAQTADRVRGHSPGLSGHPFRTAVVRELLAWQVTDLLEETARRLEAGNVRTIEDVRAATTPLVGFSPAVDRLKAGLER